jgi:Zn-dependent protease with chaperone function
VTARCSKGIASGLAALLVWLCLSVPSAAEVVYIRNQRLSVHHIGGTRVVHLEAFRKLLTADENKALTTEDRALAIVNHQGELRKFPLTAYGELAEWEAALGWLGYSRKESTGTGVVDWINAQAGLASSQPAVWKMPTAEELALRQEQSLRRPGYRAARKNYEKVMAMWPPGGSEQQRQWVRRLGYQIAEQSPLKELHWTFDVAETPIPNALCTGEGFVVVTTGLLALNLSDDEMAGVLGHEVAHGVRRHSLLFEERYGEARKLILELRELESAAAKAEEEKDNHRLQTIRSRVNEMTPRLQFLADFVKNQQAYDHNEEEEADILGMQFAAAAGFDPYGEGRALIKLRARSIEMFGQAYQEGSRTHPPLKRRLEIQTLVQKRWAAERKD